MVGLFTTPQRFVAYVFIPRICMELSDSESPVSQLRHLARQIRSATRFHLFRLPCRRLRLRIAENARRRRLASCADRVASGNANRTRRVLPGKANSPMYQTIQVRGINVRIAKCSDRIEPLLIGHDEQNVRAVWFELLRTTGVVAH